MEPSPLIPATGSSIPVALRVMCATALVVAAVVVVLVMRVGPVVLTLAPGRGIHLGDSLGIAGVIGAVWMLLPQLRDAPQPLLSGVVRGFRG